MEINRNYHREQREAERLEHRRRFEEGQSVRLGKEYSAMTGRDGQRREGPFTALAYEDGTLLVGKADGRLFAFIAEDVVANGSELYMENVPHLIRFKRDLSDILGDPMQEDACCRQLQQESSVKYFWQLSMENARMLLRWYRREHRDETGHPDSPISREDCSSLH